MVRKVDGAQSRKGGIEPDQRGSTRKPPETPSVESMACGSTRKPENDGTPGERDATVKTGWPERYRHKKRGTAYTVVCMATLQTERPISDFVALVIYEGDDGQMWARPYREFHDGRFEPLPPEPTP